MCRQRVVCGETGLADAEVLQNQESGLPPAPDTSLETAEFPNASMGMMQLFSSLSQL